MSIDHFPVYLERSAIAIPKDEALTMAFAARQVSPLYQLQPGNDDMQQDHLNREASSGTTTAAAHAQDAGKGLTTAQLLKHSLDTFLAKDIKGWAQLCDENVVVEFPFAPDVASRKLLGRPAIYEYLKNYPSVIDIQSTPTLTIRATDDPNMAIAEWSVSGRVITNGNPYEMSYATFVTFRNGLIVNYREYWNPMVFMAAMSGAMFSSHNPPGRAMFDPEEGAPL
jgi:uncharacterized protein